MAGLGGGPEDGQGAAALGDTQRSGNESVGRERRGSGPARSHLRVGGEMRSG